MAIRKLKNTGYQVDVTVLGKRKKLNCETLAQAKVQEAVIRAAFLSGGSLEGVLDINSRQAVRPPIASLEFILEAVYKRYWQDMRSAKSALINGEAILKYFGNRKDIREIKRADLDGFISHLKSIGNSPATINRKLTVYSKLQGYALSNRTITEKLPIEYLKEPRGRIRVVSREEERKLLDYVRSIGAELEADFLTVLVDTGLRTSEAASLTMRNIDGAWLRIYETKNDVPRSIPMTQRVQAIIRSRADSGLFLSLSLSKLRATWVKAKAYLLVSPSDANADSEFVPYCLRHTFASRLVQAGQPLQVVKELLGHKNIQMTMRYAHLAPSNLMDAISVLEGG